MIIHPGFLKTATTTLQEHLFAHHPQLWLLGGHCRSDLYRQISSSLRGLDGVDYDAGRLRQLIAVARLSDGSHWSGSVDVIVTLAACVES